MRALRFAALVAVCAAVQSCAVPFYWQAAAGQLELMRKRTPIERVLEDPNQDERVKQTLSRIPEIRRFAVEELHLPSNKSYTTYVDLGRPFLTTGSMGQDVIHPLIAEMRAHEAHLSTQLAKLKLPDDPAGVSEPNQHRSAAQSKWSAAHGKGA